MKKYSFYTSLLSYIFGDANVMKGIKDWAAEVANSINFLKEFKNLKSSEEIVNLAEKEGYKFSKEEFEDLKLGLAASGGKLSGDSIWQQLIGNKKIINSIIENMR